MSTQVKTKVSVPAARDGIERRKKRRVLTFGITGVALLILIILSAAIGQYSLAPAEVIQGFFARFGLAAPLDDPLDTATLWNIRLPRIALGVLVGAALAVAGAIMQAVFSNPLAEPGIIGVSSGAAVGASSAIVFFPFALGGYAVPLAAFITGGIAAFVVYVLSLHDGKTEPLTLVLTGIAVTAVCTALTSIATYIAPSTARDQIVFWQMGSLNAATWDQVWIVGSVVAIALVGALLISRRLDILALGEKAAGHVGINVQLLSGTAIVLATLLTAMAVSYAGVIAFVGLIVPHIMRLALGPLNRYLIPASLLGGALLITGSDLVARTIVNFQDLPIGIFTALVGGPIFFVLLRRNLHGGRRRS